MNLKDKVVVITGSSRGIGWAIAQRFYQLGAYVVLNSRHELSADSLNQFPEAAGYHAAQAIKADVSDENQAQALVDQVLTQYGRCDVVINNAGITRDQLANRMKLADFLAPIQVNLVGTFNVIQAVLPTFYHQRQGVILNMASVVGLVGNIGQANYAASKAGVIGLTKTIAREAARRQVRCNALAPGMIDTDMTAVLSDKAKEQLLNQIPLKRLGTAEEVAQAAQFLVENEYMTGQVLTLDGGMTMI